MPPPWSSAEYEREKRNFIATRLRFRSVYWHSCVIFTVTWLSGWLCSALLLKLGLAAMPLRYALSFTLAYPVFLGAVRVWANFMKSERGEASDASNFRGLSNLGGEGCFFVLAGMLIAMVVAGIFALIGGLPLLLEAAFEVVFAGVMVRRFSGMEVVGDWAGTLLRKTWRHALVTLALLLSVAVWLQRHAPEAKTFAEAVKILRAPAPGGR
jgi:hypothetical protein